jgi:hypothetical protein
LFSDSSTEISSLLLPFSGAFSVFLSLSLCARLQFTVYCSVFFEGVSVCPWSCAGLSLGWLGEFHVIRGTYLFILPNVVELVAVAAPMVAAAAVVAAHKCSRVMWCGDTFLGPGVQGVEVLILLGALFLPRVTSVSQQDFGVMDLALSASVP